MRPPRRGAPEHGHSACSTTHGGSGSFRSPGRLPAVLSVFWRTARQPHLRGMVEGCGQDHGDGLLLMPQGSTQPSLPAAPGTPDATSSEIAMAFHGDLLSLPCRPHDGNT